LRIDHLLLSPPLASRLVRAEVDCGMRGWEKASDPTWIELAATTKPAATSRRTASVGTELTRADPFDLERFVTAQEVVFPAVLAELKAGRKRTHWMWFGFPQLRGLGHSSMATFYGIASLHEARAYLGHPLEVGSLHEIFGSPDDMKFQSSMTLFAVAAAEPASVFYRAFDRWCGGTLDPRTLKLLEAGGPR